jgi:gas vesicle protein
MRTTTGVLLGTLAGVTVGLLLAPKKGKDLRHDISDATDQWKTKWTKMFGNGNGRINDLKKILSKEIKGLGDDARKRMLNIIEEASERNYGLYDHNGTA